MAWKAIFKHLISKIFLGDMPPDPLDTTQLYVDIGHSTLKKLAMAML